MKTIERTTISLDGKLFKVSGDYIEKHRLTFSSFVAQAVEIFLKSQGVIHDDPVHEVLDETQELIREFGADEVRKALISLKRRKERKAS